MRTETLNVAIAEAERFIEKAKALREVREKGMDFFNNPRESGAAKRASLDLTRKLADLRAGR